MRASIDNRIGAKNDEKSIEGISLDGCLGLVEKLDGKTHTLVYLDRGNGVCLMIGGGPLAFVVTITKPEDQNFTLFNESNRQDEMVEICAGGQYSEFPAAIVATRDAACAAVRKFFAGEENSINFVAEA